MRDGVPLEQADAQLLAGLIEGVVDVRVEEYEGRGRVVLCRADGSKKVCSPAWVVKRLREADADAALAQEREELPRHRSHHPSSNPSAALNSNITVPDTFTLKTPQNVSGLLSRGLTLCTLPPLLSADFTIKCCLRIKSYKSRGEFVHSRGRYVMCCTDGWWSGWVIEIDQMGLWTVRVGTGSEWVILQAEAGFVALNEWIHLGITYELDTGRLCMHLNDVGVASVQARHLAPSASPLRFGCGPHGECGSGIDGTLKHLLISPSKRPSEYDLRMANGSDAFHEIGRPRHYPRDIRLRQRRRKRKPEAWIETSEETSDDSSGHSSSSSSSSRTEKKQKPKGERGGETQRAIKLLVGEVTRLGDIVTQLGETVQNASFQGHRVQGVPPILPAVMLPAAPTVEDTGYVMSPSESDGAARQEETARLQRRDSVQSAGMSIALRRSSTQSSLRQKESILSAPLSSSVALPRPLSPGLLMTESSPPPPPIDATMSQSFKRSLWDASSATGPQSTVSTTTALSPNLDIPFDTLQIRPSTSLSVPPASPRSTDLATSRVPSAASSTTMLGRWRNLLQESESPFKRDNSSLFEETSQSAHGREASHLSIEDTPMSLDVLIPEDPLKEGDLHSADMAQSFVLGPFANELKPESRLTKHRPPAIKEPLTEVDPLPDSVNLSRWLDLIRSNTKPQYSHKGLSKPAEVRPGIFFGDGKMAKRVGDLTSRGIKKVVNLAPGQCKTSKETYFGSGIEYLEIQAEDDEAYPILRDLPAVVSFIDESPCFIHCFQGVNRSAAIIAGYVMCIFRVPLLQAIREVHRARPVCMQGNDGFLTALVHHAHRIGLLGEVEKETLPPSPSHSTETPSPRSVSESQRGRLIAAVPLPQPPQNERDHLQSPVSFARVESAVSTSTRHTTQQGGAYLSVPELSDPLHSPKHGRRRDSSHHLFGSSASLIDASESPGVDKQTSLQFSAAEVGTEEFAQVLSPVNYAVTPQDNYAYSYPVDETLENPQETESGNDYDNEGYEDEMEEEEDVDNVVEAQSVPSSRVEGRRRQRNDNDDNNDDNEEPPTYTPFESTVTPDASPTSSFVSSRRRHNVVDETSTSSRRNNNNNTTTTTTTTTESPIKERLPRKRAPSAFEAKDAFDGILGGRQNMDADLLSRGLSQAPYVQKPRETQLPPTSSRRFQTSEDDAELLKSVGVLSTPNTDDLFLTAKKVDLQKMRNEEMSSAGMPRRDSWAMQWLSDADFSDATPEALTSPMQGAAQVSTNDSFDDDVFTQLPQSAAPQKKPEVSPPDPAFRSTMASGGRTDLATFSGNLSNDYPDAIQDLAFGSMSDSAAHFRSSHTTDTKPLSPSLDKLSPPKGRRRDAVKPEVVPGSPSVETVSPAKTIGGIHQWDDWD